MSTNSESVAQTAEEIAARLRERASTDEAFRQQLLSDPKATISQEFGIAIPDAIQFHVHQSSKNNFHIALPPSSELDEEQLEQIAAGLSCCL